MRVQWLLFIIYFIILCKNVSGYIFHLNANEYARMPPIFHLDPYDSCLQENNYSGVYCSVNFNLVTDEISDLYTMIQQYSEKTEVHFNHTKLSYGICLTRTCKKFYQQNTTRDQVLSLEACLNDTMWENYKLKTQVDKKINCESLKEIVDMNINTSDITVAVLLTILFVINLVGSLQEFFVGVTGNCGRGNSVMSCFSIRQNWRRLVAPAGETHFTGFYGIKTLSIMLVIMFHSMVPYMLNAENPQYFEEGYDKIQIVVNGTLVVQSFFVMSGFLISYNIQCQAMDKITWRSVPQAIMNRCLRLTPPYLVILAVTATWMRYFGSGPLWQTAVVSQVEDCQRNWWYHLLYINNYVDYSQCLIQTWYIAADFQLFCVGVLVCVLTSGRKRMLILALLFISGLFAPAIHTYLQDLHGHFMITPEVARNILVHDPTFNNSYKRGHTNVASYVIGLTLGMLVYHWQRTGFKLHRFLRNRFTYWMTLPACVCLILLGSVFYRDAPRDPVYIRMLYSAFLRPLFGMWFSYFIVGMVFQYEDTYRNFLEWNGWTALCRVSYCAYLLHMMLIRTLAGTKRTVMHISFMNMVDSALSRILLSFLAAVPFYLLAEAPFLQLIQLYTSDLKKNPSNKMSTDKPSYNLNNVSNGKNAKKDNDEDVVKCISCIKIETQT